MLTKLDELMCHQTVAAFDCVVDSSRNWTEKIYFSAFDTSGKIAMNAGFGKYPNRNVMDGYGGVALMDRQYTVRASRELQPDVNTVKIGPLSYEVVEPLKRVRICLGENDYGVSFDLVFEGRVPALEEPAGFTRLRGKLVNHTIRFYQTGVASGEITVEGKTYEVKKNSSYAVRDHSWGIRAMAGVPPSGSWWFREGMGLPESGMPPSPPMPGLFASLFNMQFKEYGIFYTYTEGSDGRPIPVGVAGVGGFLVYPFGDTRPPIRIADGRFQFEFFPGTRRVKSVHQAVFILEDGTKLEMSTKSLGIVFHARAGGYFGFKGWWHGKWMGPYAIDGERLDLTDEKLLDELIGVNDIAHECRCGNEVGYGIVEPIALGNLPKYGLKA